MSLKPAPDWSLPAGAPEPVAMYARALPRGRYTAFPMTGLDRTGIPAWKAALFLNDAHLLPGAMPSGYGYGATDGEALTGAVAEIAEMILPTLALQPREKRMGSHTDLVRELGARHVADPLTLGLPAGSPVDRDTPLAWIAAVRAASGEPVWVPMDVGALDYFELPDGYKPFTTLITNGLGAGPDADWALAHGLLELLQRDGNGLGFRALDRGVVLTFGDSTPEGSGASAETLGLMRHLSDVGIEVIPKFASDEFGLTNLYVVGHDREGCAPASPIMLSACGEACDPDRDRALRKALLEFCSARVRKAYGHGPLADARRIAPPGYIERFVAQALPSLEVEEDRALREMTAWARMDAGALRAVLEPTVFSRRSERPFRDLPSTPCADTRARGAFARAALEAAGLDVLYVDCSPADGSCAVVKAIVPGLEVETMSYYRIGERNTRKLLERGDPLIRFGEPSDTLRPVRLAPEAAERLADVTGGRAPLLDTAAVDAAVGALYPLYREPEAHHVAYRLGELEPASA